MKSVVETERLFMRKLVRRDFKNVCKIICDGETMHEYEGEFSKAEARKWLNSQFKSYREWGFGLWAVILKDSGEFIGQCGLTTQLWNDKAVLEIGYAFRRDMWHNGYATEAAIACKTYAFEVLNASEVCSIIRDTNIPSQNVALRNGMTKTDCTVKHYKGVDTPYYMYIVKK